MIKAIETVYNGYRFRSRLEARWAVFFDTLGIEYRYEQEGFDLGAVGWYLPDFWLPRYNMWIEVKPVQPSFIEAKKCRKLAEGLDNDVLILYGSPWPNEYLGVLFKRDTSLEQCQGCGYLTSDFFEVWDAKGCPECGLYGENIGGLPTFSNFKSFPYSYETWQYDEIVFYQVSLSPDRRFGVLALQSLDILSRYGKEILAIAELLILEKTKPLQDAFIAARQARFEHDQNGH